MSVEKIERYFPDVEHGIKPQLNNVLVMGKWIPKTTSSGLILVDEHREMESHQIAIGKIVAVGPLAFKDRKTLEPWAECEIGVGDFVFVPRSGDRINKHVGEETYKYIMFTDLQITAKLETLKGFEQFKF